MKNLLASIPNSAVIREPFPHIIIEDALPQDLLDELVASFPDEETVTKGAERGSNKRFDYTIKDMRTDPTINPLWKQFLELNASREFFEDLVRLFGDEIDKRFPHFKAQYGNILNMKNGTRYLDEGSADILFDAHISINTPVVEKPSSVRAAHVDDPKKLFGGLLYLRPPQDTTSQGGELLIYRYKDKTKKQFFGQGIEEKYIEVVSKIPYKRNVFVLFLNTIDSLHGVTTREKTSYTRQFVNLVAELKSPLFDIQSLQEPTWKRRVRYWKGKLLP